MSAAVRAIAAESSAYYMLTYKSAHEENGTFHPITVRAKRAGVQLRARAGYWAPSADDRLRAEVVARANTPPVVVPLEPARRSSPLIRPWFGLSMGEDDRMKVTFVWEPAPAVPGSRSATMAARLDLTVLGDGDAVVFQGPVLPAGPEALSDGPSRAVFETAPGRLRLRMKIQDGDRRDVDTDVRDLIIRDLRGRVAIGTPEVMRARNAREFRALGADPDATPVSSRVFSRTERLLIRLPGVRARRRTDRVGPVAEPDGAGRCGRSTSTPVSEAITRSTSCCLGWRAVSISWSWTRGAAPEASRSGSISESRVKTRLRAYEP